ncbi:MAG: AMP-binding protein [Aquiluna sp.]
MSKDVRFVSSQDPERVLRAVNAAVFEGGDPVFVHAPDRPALLNGPLPHTASVVIETSGSTGSPKQVWFEKETLIASAELTSSSMGPVGTWWLTLPVHYIAGLQVVIRSLISESELIIAPQRAGIVRQFQESLPSLTAAKERGERLYSSLVPAQVHALLDAVESGVLKDRALGVFDRVLVGGGRIPDDLISRAANLGLHITKTYGMAETSGGCVWDGAPLDGVAVREHDGRIALSGPMLAGGYIGDDKLTRQSFVETDGKRWFISQDLGSVVDGHLSVTGRVDDVISSGGVKLNLAEVESFLHNAGLISDAIVVSIPDAKWGDVPAVFSASESNFDGIKDQVISHFGPHAGPALFMHLDEMPLLSSGKPDRQSLREYAIREREHSVDY